MEKREISESQKRVFSLLLILIPVILILLGEASLRLIGYGSNLDLFVKSKDYAGYYEVNKDVTKRFFTQFGGTSPSNDLFLVNKTDNCYRVFVMGCSSTRGFPYTMGTSFTRILNYRLQAAFPDKRIEVVNTAMAAVNSYTQLDFIDEILEMKPDAILIYTGHNEYYGALGVASVENGGNKRWIKRMHLSLIKYRTYQLVQAVVGKITGIFVKDTVSATATLMERIVSNKAIPYQSDAYKAGIEQFNVNMDEVVERICAEKVPVIFSEAVSNISGNAPFSSLKVEGYLTANEAFEKAAVLEGEGKFSEARKMYFLAKDLDGVRFRAPEELNAVIREIGNKYSVPVIDMKAVFEKHSPNGIIGNSLMTEHLHPNIDGYFLMADAFFNAMQKEGLIASNWDSSLIKSWQYYRANWGFTELDSLKADLTVKALKAGWPFQPDTVVNKYIYTYKPSSVIDSIAHMCVLYDNVSVEDKHRFLAKTYLNNGEKQKAFNEYYALIKINPYNTFIHYEALKIILELNDYSKALDILIGMPNRNTDFFANYQMGLLYQRFNEHHKAIQSFETARKFIAKNDNLEALLAAEYNSCKLLSDTARLAAVLLEIRKINPNFNLSDTQKKEVVVYIDKDVRDLIQGAMQLVKQQKFSEALAALQKSLKIKETAFALQLMGNIYLQLNDPRALPTMERAYGIDPKDIKTINNLFVIYLNNKNYLMASKMLEEYKLLSPDKERITNLSNMLNRELNKK